MVLRWLQDWPHPHVSLPDIYQFGPNAIREKKTAAEAVQILEDHGWLLQVTGGTEVNGHFRRDAWLVVREV